MYSMRWAGNKKPEEPGNGFWLVVMIIILFGAGGIALISGKLPSEQHVQTGG